MPEHITIVRGRDDNPVIPVGFNETDIVLISLDEHGKRCEEHLFFSATEVR